MNREFKFDLQEVDEKGEFWGVSAVYNNVDLGQDLIQPGAFSKTLSENGDKVPLLLDHRIPIGIASLEDSEVGLKTHAKLNLEKEVARDAYSDLKFYKKEGKPYGMSIGYLVKNRKPGEGSAKRILTEVQLFETSITITPMNVLARVADVKRHGDEQLKEFLEATRKMRDEYPDQFKEFADELSKLFALPNLLGTSTEAATKSADTEAAPPIEAPDIHAIDWKALNEAYREKLRQVA